MINVIIFLSIVVGFALVFYVFFKLNRYIQSLEDKVQRYLTVTENLKQSLTEIVAEGYLQNDGRLKKFSYQKENRNRIVNGVSDSEEIIL